MCLTPSTWKVQDGEARSAVKTMLCCPLPIPFTGQWANCSGADAQVVSCHCILSSFILLLSSLVHRLPYLDLLWRRLLSSESLTSIVIACAKQVRKLCVNPYISIVNLLQTYKHTNTISDHQCLLHQHNYEPHAKAFSNKNASHFIMPLCNSFCSGCE